MEYESTVRYDYKKGTSNFADSTEVTLGYFRRHRRVLLS